MAGYIQKFVVEGKGKGNAMERRMYVYQSFESGLWTVGFYTPTGEWVAESDHASPEAAAERVAWLNGAAVSAYQVGTTVMAKPTKWEQLSWRTKMNILEGESTVLVDLLLENVELVRLVKGGASKEKCLDFINANW